MADFFAFLSQPECRPNGHQGPATCRSPRRPTTHLKTSGFYDKNPGTDVCGQADGPQTTDKSRGIRLGNFLQIRDIIDEELEVIWAGKKTAQQGLDDAVARGNEQIQRFPRTAKE